MGSFWCPISFLSQVGHKFLSYSMIYWLYFHNKHKERWRKGYKVSQVSIFSAVIYCQVSLTYFMHRWYFDTRLLFFIYMHVLNVDPIWKVIEQLYINLHLKKNSLWAFQQCDWLLRKNPLCHNSMNHTKVMHVIFQTQHLSGIKNPEQTFSVLSKIPVSSHLEALVEVFPNGNWYHQTRSAVTAAISCCPLSTVHSNTVVKR